MMRMMATAFSVWLAVSTAARADDTASPEAVALAKSFAKICLLELPNFESVILRAKIEGWKQVEGPAREPILHRDSKLASSSWLTKGVDDVTIGVTMIRQMDSARLRQVWTCAVQNPEVSAKGLAPVLVNLLTLPDATPDATPDAIDREGKHELITRWKIRYGVQLVDIALVTDAAGKPGVMLNAIQFRGTPD